jgi:hypothetical protein
MERMAVAPCLTHRGSRKISRLLLWAWLAAAVAGFAGRAEAGDTYLDCDIEETPAKGAKSSYRESIKFRLIVDSRKAQDNWGNEYHLRPAERGVELLSEPGNNIKLVYQFSIDLTGGVLSGTVRYRGEVDPILRATGTCARSAPPKT